ncbi:MAG: formate dehydrogenase accessory sulfurtransferase FdhD [Ilumatobacteraceae bacterium]
MARGRTERVLVTVVDGSTSRRRPDSLIVEEPLTIQLNGVAVATTMRTPGHDFELAVGFCHTEGLLVGPEGRPVVVTGVRYCGTGSAAETEFNVTTVETGSPTLPPTPRLGPVSSSCGWCGSAQLDAIAGRVAALPPTDPFSVDVLRSVPALVADHQDLFARTGAVHAAAVFDASGRVDTVREDVGRHNAVDKVVGAMLLAGRLPATDLGLFVSGRASVEMVVKAWSAGFGTLVAVSAPTALAVSAARRAGMCLVGFTRDRSCNVYSPERLSGEVTPADR